MIHVSIFQSYIAVKIRLTGEELRRDLEPKTKPARDKRDGERQTRREAPVQDSEVSRGERRHHTAKRLREDDGPGGRAEVGEKRSVRWRRLGSEKVAGREHGQEEGRDETEDGDSAVLDDEVDLARREHRLEDGARESTGTA